MSSEDPFKTKVYKIEVVINQDKNPFYSDKELLSSITQWIQTNMEHTNNNIINKHGLESGYSFAISYHEQDRINPC